LGVLGREAVTPFRKQGGGTLLGEGATVLVLRRLGDALRDGQRVRVVLRGLGVASSGGSRALFTSSEEGQVAALREAYSRAGYGPEAVQYVEAHANGLPEGDRVELEALNAVFAPAVGPGGRVALGSMKDRIGYLLSGAGAAGLARTVLAMEEGVLPYQADPSGPDEELPFARGPFHLNTQPAAWTPAAPGLPRRAGVSAFGFGGVNYHLTLESFEPEYHRAAPSAPVRRTLREEPVAVLGQGVVLPGSPDPESLWSNLLTGRELGQEQQGAWFASRPRDWDGVRGAYVSRAARVEGFRFASERLRLPPKVAERMEPAHLWVVSAAEQALAQAGLRGALPERTAVFLAATPGGQRVADLELRVAYAEFDAALERALEEAGVAGAHTVRQEAERRFKAPLPTFSEDSLLGTLRNVAAGRLAQALGARGPCYSLDAACASSCAALESAVRGLLAGDFDLAIVGGFWSGLSAEYFLNTAAFGGNSAGVCRPFDARADGAIPGEGAAVVVLQREREARAGARPVQALIRGLGASGNGQGGSLYSASVPAMVRAIRAALEEPGVAPETVGLVEAHGSCTPVGDGAELKALGSVYGGEGRAGPVVLACLKASLGNLMAVSGVASLVATVLSLRHGLAPPVLHSRWDESAPPESRAFRLPSVARPFGAAPGQPRRAAVSAYAMGGVNYHLLVEAAPPPDAREAR
ncbi:MAG TPA: polyketide synthase, partial [Myxococcus sp.]|nr:polyketide synthase [Myxococcus sp.]